MIGVGAGVAGRTVGAMVTAGATVTAAGVATVVATFGMAVDKNAATGGALVVAIASRPLS